MKINKIFSMLFGGLLLTGAAACTDETEYTPVDKVADNGVFFPADAPEKVDILTDASSTSVTICRTNADAELTVGLQGKVTDADGNDLSNIFSVPTQVTFPAGTTSMPVEIPLIFGDITPEYQYKLSLRILGEEQSPYGLSEREFILVYEPWTDWEPYKYSTAEDEEPKVGYVTCTFTMFYDLTIDMPMYVRKSEVNEHKKQYMIPDPASLEKNQDDPDFDPTKDCDFYYIINFDDSPAYNIMVGDTQCSRVTIQEINSGQNDADGNRIMAIDYFSFIKDIINQGNASDDWVLNTMANNGIGNSYYNPKKGLFCINLYLWPKDMTQYTYGDGYEYFQLPGYHDYFIAFSYSGNFVDGTGMEKAIVQAYRSDDVASYAYTCLPGALDKAAIDAAAEEIKKDTEAELVFEPSTNLTFSCGDNGTYTIVAVGYNKSGEAVCTSSYQFEYKSVQKDKEWKSLGYCKFTDGIIYGHWIMGEEEIGGEEWDVEVEESLKTPGLYRLVNPYYSWPFNVALGNKLSLSGNYYIYFNAADPNAVYLIDSALGMDFKPIGVAGEQAVESQVYYWLSNGTYDLATIAANGWCGTNDNGVITFPAATLFLTYGSKSVYTNFNDDLLAAAEANENWQDIVPNWGPGYTTIDMSAVSKSMPKKSYAAASSRSVSSLGRLATLPHNTYRGIRRTAVTKVSHADMQKNRTLHFKPF